MGPSSDEDRLRWAVYSRLCDLGVNPFRHEAPAIVLLLGREQLEATAAQLAAKLECSVSRAYAALKELREAEVIVHSNRLKPGALPRIWALTDLGRELLVPPPPAKRSKVLGDIRAELERDARGEPNPFDEELRFGRRYRRRR